MDSPVGKVARGSGLQFAPCLQQSVNQSSPRTEILSAKSLVTEEKLHLPRVISALCPVRWVWRSLHCQWYSKKFPLLIKPSKIGSSLEKLDWTCQRAARGALGGQFSQTPSQSHRAGLVCCLLPARLLGVSIIFPTVFPLSCLFNTNI